MAWSTIGSIKGAKGDDGDPGEEVSLRVNGGNIEWQLGAGTWTVLISLEALTGPAGTSVTIAGSVADAASLPTGLGAGDNGDGYITQDDGHLHVWDGDSFNDVGTVRGPAGIDGTDGTNGLEVGLQVSGGYIQWRLGTGSWTNLISVDTLKGDPGDTGARGTLWFTGTGAPGTLAGSAAGDLYLDTATGDIYKLV